MHRESSRDRILFFESLEIITRQIPSLPNGKDLNASNLFRTN
jgi:hypothetical protein